MIFECSLIHQLFKSIFRQPNVSKNSAIFRKINKAKQHLLQKYCMYCEPGLSSKAESTDGLNLNILQYELRRL